VCVCCVYVCVCDVCVCVCVMCVCVCGRARGRALSREHTLLSLATSLFNLIYHMKCHTTISAVLEMRLNYSLYCNREFQLLKLKEYHLTCHSPSHAWNGGQASKPQQTQVTLTW